MAGKLEKNYLEQFVAKTKSLFFLSKQRLTIALVLTYILPLLACQPDLSLYSLAFFGVLGGLFLFGVWERKLKDSVEALIRAKIKGLSLPTPETEARLKAKELEVSQLKRALEESIRGYEHQIDLLQSSAAKSREKAQELSYEMERQSEGVKSAHLRYEDVRREYGYLHDEYLALQTQANEKLKRNDSLLAEYQHTMNEQRLVIEKKQRHIAKLETKVGDLMYEIRSLLKLEQPQTNKLPFEEPNETQEFVGSKQEGGSHFDLSHLLNRYLEMAQGLTGVDHLGYLGGSAPRFLDTTHGSYHLDLRRLFDSFREESLAIVFVYSRLEGKFLFVNNHVKNLTGWSPEKFIKDFHHLVVKGLDIWEKELQEVKAEKQRAIPLLIQSKTGKEIHFQTLFSIISQGPFAGHVVGVISPLPLIAT